MQFNVSSLILPSLSLPHSALSTQHQNQPPIRTFASITKPLLLFKAPNNKTTANKKAPDFSEALI